MSAKSGFGRRLSGFGLAGGLVHVARRDQIVPARTDVADLERPRVADLLLDVDVPVFHPRRLQIPLIRGRGLRDEDRERCRERICQRDGASPAPGKKTLRLK